MSQTKGRTNKQDNWTRLQMVIDWTHLSTNAFAKSIGIQRAENLYNIKRGYYGISCDLADRIVATYPEVDRTWLLSGMGTMLRDTTAATCSSLMFYNVDAESTITHIESLEPSGSINLPYINNCDFVIRSFSRSMADPQCAASDLFVKRVEPEEIVQGNEYLLTTDAQTIWRKVRVSTDESHWRLVSRNREEFPDIMIEKSSVVKAWRVMARLAVMTN